MDFNGLNLKKAHLGLKNKEFSALELTKYFLDVIKNKDKNIHAFLKVTDDLALEQAKLVDKKIKEGKEIKPLSGMPMALKDNMAIEGITTTAGSRMLENYVPPFDSTTVKKLKENNFVLLGRTNLDEFAMGSSTENSAFGPTKNPLDTSLVPGGSSGGSAAAVAAGMSLYALGSDTGGSIRQPAAFCGVVGLKPTYGRVSRYGLIALTSSTDVIGSLTKDVEDAALILEAIAGFDEKDSTTINKKIDCYSQGIDKKSKLRIGIPKEYFGGELDQKIKQALNKVIKQVKDLKIEVIDISLPYTEYAVAAYYIINPAETSSNLARFDGIRYGFSDKESKKLLETYLNSRQKGFGPEPKRRIMLGTYALSFGYYEAYYLRAQKARKLISDDFAKAFEKVDIILTPTAPSTAFKLGEKQTPLEMYLSDVFLTAPSLAGLPALSLPFYTSEKMPYSVQLIAGHFEEKKLLNFGYLLEKEVLDKM